VRPLAANGSGTCSVSSVRMSQNSTLPAVQLSAASWSMPPVGAPTKSFSALRVTLSSSPADSRSPSRSSTAVATAQVSAADDDSPAPGGTVLSSAMRRPGTSAPSLSSAHTTPAA